MQEIRSAIDDHDSVFLFSYENMRSHLFKKVRMDFREPYMEGKSSRIFLGKNKHGKLFLQQTHFFLQQNSFAIPNCKSVGN